MPYKRGKFHHRWKGGRHLDSYGYILVYAPNHPNCIDGKYIREHRLVMSNHLKRPLEPTEHIHHINGDRTDNRFKNLELINRSKHAYNHGKKNSNLPSFKGRKHTKETKKKMRFAKLGKKRKGSRGQWILDSNK
jgi:hypothetical protein